VSSAVRAACVIGWPIEHSRSPLIHNYWLKRYRIPGAYRSEAVLPDQFRNFVRSLAERGYVGANVTVPHKEAALALSHGDDRARAVGAANTLWLDGVLHSTNTDVEGFLHNLSACAPGWESDAATAVVLGAGGAARAVVYGLLERGTRRIIVSNRTPGRALELQARFAERFASRVQVAPWAECDRWLAEAKVLVNATTLGMQGQPDLTIDIQRLSADAVVADLVYAPLVTPLLRAASARGLRTADGLGMLIYQAMRGFQLWFGKRPEITSELRTLLERDLSAARPASEE
jgi:shikimate dehydrogenase